jgi:cyclin C
LTDYSIILISFVAISKLGRKLRMRQRVIATAIIYFKRFYLKNNYSDTDPLFVAAACCYVAAKAEESPIHIKQVAHDAHAMFARTRHMNKW